MICSMNTDELIKAIIGLKKSPNQLVIIGISGFGGAGKSTLANLLKQQLGGAEVVPIDDFIIGPKDQRSSDWATFDRPRLIAEILEVARPNKVIKYMQYQSGVWANNLKGKPREIKPSRYLIVEGCSVIHPILTKYYDLSVWVDVPLDVATAQAKARDSSQTNNQDKLWDEVWNPNDLDYFNQFRPDWLADVKLRSRTTRTS